jgi:hypothetical protein
MRQLAQSRQHGRKWPLSAPEATFDASSVPPLNDFENARFRARPHIPRDADVISVLDYLRASHTLILSPAGSFSATGSRQI